MQLLAKFKKILFMRFRATLNFRKLKEKNMEKAACFIVFHHVIVALVNIFVRDGQVKQSCRKF